MWRTRACMCVRGCVCVVSYCERNKRKATEIGGWRRRLWRTSSAGACQQSCPPHPTSESLILWKKRVADDSTARLLCALLACLRLSVNTTLTTRWCVYYVTFILLFCERCLRLLVKIPSVCTMYFKVVRNIVCRPQRFLLRWHISGDSELVFPFLIICDEFWN